MKPDIYIGLMSGTSLDGIDAVLMNFSGSQPELLGTHYSPYTEELRNELLALHHPVQNELHLASLMSNKLARSYADAVLKLLSNANVHTSDIHAIGCHGQTIRHRPELGYTIQLCNGALLAESTGITVINDFRSRDIAAGGQGAPLVPAFHDQVLRHPGQHRVIVNIGGISNLTNLAPGRAASGFDCGPGNLLMDAWIQQHLGKHYDAEGSWAASGTVLQPLLQKMLQENYFSLLPPKSCGRDLFNLFWLNDKLLGNEKPEDVQATLLELTSLSICNSILEYCQGVESIYLCGGGAHNLALHKRLKQLLPEIKVSKTDELGISADWLESIAFAWLAKKTLDHQPANLPTATGARHPCILGAIHQA